MKASETKVQDFLSLSKTQFIIPIYQRNYDWGASQCKQLLHDILEVGAKKQIKAHFIGSVVYIHDDIYTSSKTRELTIIDGQQRLTTLTIIYLVIVELAKQLGDESLVNEISETYLINKFAQEQEKLKLRSTDDNHDALKHLLKGERSEYFAYYSKIIDNFNFFKQKINKENYQTVLEGLSKLMFVEISLDRDKDDPQRIFESLNSNGLDLSQADLIRNYILMGLNRKEQKKIYQNYWEVIETLAKDESNNSRVSDYIRDYLTLENKKIPNKSQVYLEFKTKYPHTDLNNLEKNLTGLKTLAYHYNKLINPQKETDRDIRLQIEYINRLEINVAFPFLMRIYDDFIKSIIDKKIFLQILNLIQSFVWRRSIVGLQTNALSKIFMNLYEKIDTSKYLFSIQKSLIQRSGTQRFPKDKELIEALKVKDIYNIKPKNRIYLLERIENFENKEQVLIDKNRDITIEHIFPQNPDHSWKKTLEDEEFLAIKENYLNTIANLTLSGNNNKLGNKPFLEKRDLPGGYSNSRLWLNKYLSTIDKWGIKEIETRFNQISERVLKIWEYPKISIEEEIDKGEINIFEAEDPTFKKLEYAILFDQKIEVTQVSKLYAEVFKQLFERNPEIFFTTDLYQKINLTHTDAGVRQPVKISDTYFIEGNMDSLNKFERIKQALIAFDCEEELIIKYQP